MYLISCFGTFVLVVFGACFAARFAKFQVSRFSSFQIQVFKSPARLSCVALWSPAAGVGRRPLGDIEDATGDHLDFSAYGGLVGSGLFPYPRPRPFLWPDCQIARLGRVCAALRW